MKTDINPSVLSWARQRNSLTVEQFAKLLSEDPAEVRLWEEGKSSPTYSTLETIAYRHLKVPIAVFYFPSPPDVDDPVSKFRRLPDFELERLSPDTLQIIRRAQAYQDSLIELLESNPSPKPIFRMLKRRSDPNELAKEARKCLGVSIDQQYAFGGNERAFKGWRHALEEAGVFTFKDTLKDRFISGFCLIHDEFPLILVNNSNAFSRQIFSLAHELGHILLGIVGVTDVDETYFEFLSTPQKRLEVMCNKFAAELLVPADAFRQEVPLLRERGIDAVAEVAAKYCVSREVILRRCLDDGVVTEDEYRQKAGEWNRDFLRPKTSVTGGNYYLTKIAYLGEGFTRSAFNQYALGRLTKSELAAHLNINARNIDALQSRLGW